MKFSTIIMLLVCAAALFALANAQAGVTTSVNMGALNNLISTILPRAFEEAKKTPIPDVKSGHKKIQNIHITSIGLNEFKISADPSGWIQLRISRFFVHSDMKFRYKHRFIKYSCGVTAKLDRCDISFDTQFANSNGSPAVKVGNIGVNCGDASIKLRGNLIAKLFNAIKSLFKGKIKSAIISSVRGAVSKGLEGFARGMSSSLKLRTAISNWGSMNLALSDAVGYTNNSITVHFDGEVQRADNHAKTGQKRYATNFKPNGSLFSVAVSTFVFNSGFETFTKLGKFNRSYDAAHPGNFGPFLTTTAFKTILPELYTKYPDKKISYHLQMHGIPQISAKGGVGSLAASPLVIAKVDNTNVFTIRLDLSSGATIALIDKDGWRVIPQIQGLNVSFNVAESKVGTIDLKLINGLLQLVFDVATSVINGEMIQGVSIPSVNGMKLTDPKFVIVDNTFIANTGIHFDL